jgi:subtilase family serine protease
VRTAIGGALVAVLGAIAIMAAAPGALAAGRVGRAARLGSAPAQQPLKLDLPLKTDAAGLARFAAAVSDPSSPEYGQYEPVATLSRRYGATSAQRRHVVSYLRSVGASDVSIDVTGQFADATMPVAAAARVFGTGLASFRVDTASGAERFVAPTARVHVPAALVGAVTGVVGLDTERFQQPQPDPLPTAERPAPGLSGLRGLLARWSSRSAFSSSAAADMNIGSGYTPRTGTAAGCPQALAQPNGFTPNQYRQAYNIGVAPAVAGNGTGERVAVVEIDGFKPSDITTFATCFGLPTGRIKVFHVGVRRNLSPGFETTLDLEMLMASAPGVYARGVDVYQTVPTGSVVLRALTAPLRRPNGRPDVISASLGICEQNLLQSQAIGRAGADAFNRTLEVAAADGVSVVSSAGDSGSTACLNPTTQPEKPFRFTAVSFPASSPWVTGVGGTNVALTAANGIAGQVVWNNSPALLDAGGGGYSRLFRRPGYQRGFTRARHRVVPDVSMLADPFPGYLIYCSAQPGCVNRFNADPWTPFGGTSAGAPLLAGAFALIDAALRTHGHPNLGFANPLLYEIARSKLRHAVFRDVRTGSNDVFRGTGRGVGCCSAKRGFDAASGLGSLNIGALIFAAAAETHRYARLAVRVPRQRHVVGARALRVAVHCSRACRFVAYAKIRITGRPGGITAESRPHVRYRRGRVLVTIHLPRHASAKIATALRHRRRVTASLYAAIVDATGKIEHHTPGAKLRIRGA